MIGAPGLGAPGPDGPNGKQGDYSRCGRSWR
jgi:hypothetical protein